MSHKVDYQKISNRYDLLDSIYFKEKSGNPRIVMSNYVGDEDFILDICTGTASNAIVMKELKPEVHITGIDRSQDMIALGRKKIESKHLDISLVNMDATDLKFADGTFDVVIISLVLHEIEAKLARKIILEAKRVLKKNGKIIIIEWEMPEKIKKKMLFSLIYFSEPGDFKDFLKMDMNLYFKQFGFKITQIEHCDYTKVLILEVDE